ncbi:MAG: hypothetical protein ACRDA5_05585 [Clostridium sp.]
MDECELVLGIKNGDDDALEKHISKDKLQHYESRNIVAKTTIKEYY